MQDSGAVEAKLESGGFKLALAIHEPIAPARAAIILCPGYLDSKDYPHLMALGQACAKAGILAVRLDPVGTWASMTTASRATCKILHP